MKPTSLRTALPAYSFNSANLAPYLCGKTLRSFLLLAMLSLFATAAWPQSAGSPDPSWIVTQLPHSTLSAIALQPDGKVVAIGRDGAQQEISVYRFDHTGNPDATFGTTGRVSTGTGNINSSTSDIVVDPAGRIYVAGGYVDSYNQVTTRGYTVIRYLANGTLDSSFGEGGIARIPLSADKPFDPLGLTYTLPAAEQIFGKDGLSITPRKIALQPDGKLLFMSYGHETSAPASVNSVVMVRFNQGGQLDPTFATNGLVLLRLTGLNGTAGSLRVANDGSIFVAGCEDDASVGYIFKFTAQGNLDSDFGPGGKVDLQLDDEFCPAALAIRSDNKVVLGGRLQFAPGENTAGDGIGILVLRLNANGVLDTSFSSDGYSFHDLTPNIDQAIGLAMEPDGKIVVAGHSYISGANQSNPVLMRLTRGGQLDTTFGAAGIVNPAGHLSVDLEVSDAAYLLTRNVPIGQPADPNRFSVRKFITNVVDPTVPPRISGYSSQQGLSDSDFSIAIRNGNNQLVSTLPLNQILDVTGYVFPQAADEDVTAHIYVVAATPFGWYMRKSDGTFVPWNGNISTLVPAYENKPLNGQAGFSLFTGNLPAAGTYSFYLGYMRVDSTELIYTASGSVVEMSGP